MSPLRGLSNQRGIALPMAMLTLVILAGLGLAFSALSASEPTIASNQVMVARARAVAEAGVELAIWALMHPAEAGGVPVAGPVPAPYDGSRAIAISRDGVGAGTVRVTIASGQPGCLSAAERCVTAVGRVPDERAAGPRASQTIAVTLGNPRRLFPDLPAALVAHGDLQARGAAVVDARADASCGSKAGAIASGAASVSGASIYGRADGNDVANETASAADGPATADVVYGAAPDSLAGAAWSDADIAFLRTYARARGTYLRGPADFGSANRLRDGLVFVDTPSGRNLGADTAPGDAASATITGPAAADPSGVFRGWLFVNGGLSVAGDFRMHGLVYAQGEVAYRGAGSLAGAVVGKNAARVSPAVLIDAPGPVGASISFDCAIARSGDRLIADSWMIMPGTYREVCDACAG